MTAAPLPASRASTRDTIVPSRLFGPLRVDLDRAIVFPDGLLGFAGERRFVLLPAAREGVYWLQSVDDGSVAFLLVDPFPIFPGYTADVPEPADGQPPLVLVIVTLSKDDGAPCTANLQGPVAIGLGTRSGAQVILADPVWTTRHAFDLRARLAE